MKFNKTKVYTLGLLVSVAVSAESKSMDLLNQAYKNLYKQDLTRKHTDRLATNQALDREIHQAPRARDVAGVGNLIDAREADDVTPLHELAVDIRTDQEKDKLDADGGAVVSRDAVEAIIKSAAQGHFNLGEQLDRDVVTNTEEAMAIVGDPDDTNIYHAQIIKALKIGLVPPAVYAAPTQAQLVELYNFVEEINVDSKVPFKILDQHHDLKEALHLVKDVHMAGLTLSQVHESQRQHVLIVAAAAAAAAGGPALPAGYRAAPTEAQINEGIRLDKAKLPNASLIQIAESLRLDATGLAFANINQINESLRLQAAHAGFVPTAEQINEALSLKTVANPHPTQAEIDASLVRKVVGNLDAAELAEFHLMTAAPRGFVNPTKRHVQESLRLASAAGGNHANATPAEVNEGLRLGNTSTIADINESLHHGAVAFAGAPANLRQAQEGVRLAGLIGAGGHATPDQITEGLRIGGNPTVAVIDEGIRLHGGTAAEIAESLRLNITLGAPATLPQARESLRLGALLGAGVPATPQQIIEGARIGGNPTVAVINEGIRLRGGTAAEIAESLRLAVTLGAPATLLQARESLRIAGNLAVDPLNIVLHATPEQIIEGLRLGGDPSVRIINEGLRLGGGVVGGGTVAVIEASLRLGNGGGALPGGATLAQAQESVRLDALLGAGVHATPQQILEGLRLTAFGGAFAVPSVDQINEGLRIHGFPGHPVATADQITEGLRLAGLGVVAFAAPSVDQINEGVRIHGLPGNPVATTAQITEGLRLIGLGAAAFAAPSVGQINEGIRIHGFAGNPVATADMITESLRLQVAHVGFIPTAEQINESFLLIAAGTAAPTDVQINASIAAKLAALLTAPQQAEQARLIGLRVPAFAAPTIEQINEGLRIHALAGNPVATPDLITEGVRLIGLRVAAFAAPSLEQINEGIRIHALAGNPVATPDMITEGLRLIGLGVAAFAAPSVDQINEGIRIHALAGNPVATPDLITEGLRLIGLRDPAFAAPSVDQINEGIRIHGLRGHPVATPVMITEGLRLIGLGVAAFAAPSVDQINEGIRIHALAGNPVATPDMITEGLRLAGLRVAAFAAPSADQINEGIRIHALAGNPVATPDLITEGLRLIGLRDPAFAAPSEDQINEGIRIHALRGHPVATADMITEGLRLQNLAANDIAAPTEDEINEGIRLQALVAAAPVVAGRAPVVIDALTIEEGLYLAGGGVDPSLAEIVEGRRLWDEALPAAAGAPAGAAAHIDADLDMINTSIMIGKPPVSADLGEQLEELARLSGLGVDDALITIANAQEALRLKRLPGALFAGRPFAAGVDQVEFVEALRIKAFPDLVLDGVAQPAFAFTHGATAEMLIEAVRLKGLAEFEPVNPADLTSPSTYTAEDLAAAVYLQTPVGVAGFRAATIADPDASQVRAAALLRKKVDPASVNPAILQPTKDQTKAVARAKTAPMKTAVAKAIQNGAAGLAIGALPYGVATVTNTAHGYAELKFVKVSGAGFGALPANLLFDYDTGAALGAPLVAHKYDYTVKVSDANLAAVPGLADGDTIVFTQMNADPANVAGGTDFVTLVNPTKMN